MNVGDEAPEFAGQTLDDEEIELGDYRGKVVLVDFWATWCGPCVAELPNVTRAHEQYGQDGDFVVIGVSLDESKDAVRKFVKQKNIPWAQIVGGPAKENEIAKKYGVEGIPATFLIDRQGKVVAKDLRGKDLLTAVRKHTRARTDKEKAGAENQPESRRAAKGEEDSRE